MAYVLFMLRKMSGIVRFWSELAHLAGNGSSSICIEKIRTAGVHIGTTITCLLRTWLE